MGNVILTSALGFTTLLFWAMYGHWIVPPVLTAVCLTAFTLSTLVLIPSATVHSVTIAWLLVSCWVLALGCHVGMSALRPGTGQGNWFFPGAHWTYSPNPGHRRPLVFIRPRTFFLFCFICGIAAHLMVIADAQVDLDRLMSIDGIVSLGREMAIMRYFEDYSPPLPARLLGTLSLTGLLVAGVTIAQAHSKPLFPYAALQFVPLLLGSLIHTARSGFLMGCVMFFSSFVVGAGYAGYTRSFFRRIRAWGISLVLFLAIFAVFVQAQRGGDLDPENVSEAAATVRDGILGSLASFDQWFTAADGSTMRWGFYTFGGVFTLLGAGERVPGVYESAEDIGETTTNIYTAMRGLLEDFSLPGALLFLFLFGFCWGYSFMKVRMGSLHHWLTASMCYGAFLYGFVISLLTYNTVILAWLLAFGYLMLPRIMTFLPMVPVPSKSGHDSPSQP